MKTNTDRSEGLSNQSVHADGSSREKMSVNGSCKIYASATTTSGNSYTIINRFCYYWNPDDKRKNKDIIIIEDGVKGYYTTDYPRRNKDQIMRMNRNMGLSDNEVYEICQCNCKIIFAFEPTGIMEKLLNRSGQT